MRHRFLFWNLNKRQLQNRVCSIASAHEVDVIALAESGIDPLSLEAALRAIHADFRLQPSDRHKIQVFARSQMGACVEQFVDITGSLSIRRFDLPEAPSILLAVLHTPSKLNWSSTAQAMHAVELAADIRRVEADIGHDRTVVVGDLNMNPYEPGIVGRQAFNAVMTRAQVRVQTRTVQGRKYPVFYNPMWQFFGDRPSQPSGTYYHRSSPPDSHVWNIYDQVLVRPSLCDHLNGVRIVETDGLGRFVNSRGVPVRQNASDHLPLLFDLNFRGGTSDPGE